MTDEQRREWDKLFDKSQSIEGYLLDLIEDVASFYRKYPGKYRSLREAVDEWVGFELFQGGLDGYYQKELLDTVLGEEDEENEGEL